MLRKALFLKLVLLFMLSGCENNQPVQVGLQPFGHFNKSFSDSIASAVKHTYGAEVYLLTNKQLPKEAFIHVKTARYRADSLIRFLLADKDDSTPDYIMGLTDQDISMTKRNVDGLLNNQKALMLTGAFSVWVICRAAVAWFQPTASTIRIKEYSSHD